MLRNPIKSAFIFAGILIIVCTAKSFSAWEQSLELERTIKCSGDYYWGEAVGDSLEQTRLTAKKEAIQSINQTISVVENLRVTDSKDIYKDEYVFNARTFSRLQIQGINYLESQRNRKYRVVAYLSKSDFKRTTENIAAEVKEQVGIAEKKEQEQGIAEAIFAYYYAYLTALMSPQPVRYVSSRKTVYNDVKPFLFDKISSFLSNIQISAASPKIDPTFDLITVPVHATFEGKPLNGVAVRFDMPDGSERSFEKGSTDLFLYAEPSARVRKYSIIVNVALDGKNGRADLVDVHKESGIYSKRQVEVDFSNIISIDFAIEKDKNSRCSFVPHLSNVSVSNIEWNFGDGKTSTDYSPSHFYNVNNEYTATLMINNSSDLMVSRTIRANDCSVDTKPGIARLSQPLDSTHCKTMSSKNTPLVIRNLADAQDYQSFVRLLEEYKSKSMLMFGTKSTFLAPSECYVFIMDKDTRSLIAVLDRGDEKRTDILTNTIISDFENKFKQKLSLWVEVY